MGPTLLFIQEGVVGVEGGLSCEWGVESRFIDGQFSGNKGLGYLH